LGKRLRITGVVQGVGYRAGFSMQARRLNLSGWVRNRLDGSVEAMVCGDADAIDNIIAWARHGPAGAQVRDVSIVDAVDTEVKNKKFAISPTE